MTTRRCSQSPPGQALVAATDTLVEGVTFLAGAPPQSIGHQALAVNLSDLAAMGAEPAWALLSLSLPGCERATGWTDFAAGFHALARAHGVALVGGDTVRGPLVVTVAGRSASSTPALALAPQRRACPATCCTCPACRVKRLPGSPLVDPAHGSTPSDPLRAPIAYSPSRESRSGGRCAAARPPRWTSPTGCSAISASCARRAAAARNSTSTGCRSRLNSCGAVRRAALRALRALAAATTTSCCSRCRGRRGAAAARQSSAQSLALRRIGSASRRTRRAVPARRRAGDREREAAMTTSPESGTAADAADADAACAIPCIWSRSASARACAVRAGHLRIAGRARVCAGSGAAGPVVQLGRDRRGRRGSASAICGESARRLGVHDHRGDRLGRGRGHA